MPEQSNAPNLSGAPNDILSARRIINRYAHSTTMHPSSPNSSPITLNIKSLSANGKNRYFCLELNKPTPKNPPAPSP